MSSTRLAFIVSHPIQYYVPLYRAISESVDFKTRVFYTWHGGSRPVYDPGFKRCVQWDIDLLSGYESEAVPNISPVPGTSRFLGLINPSLMKAVLGWDPDIVHITGYAGLSHLLALRKLHNRKIPILFRGDSHLLDSQRSGLRWLAKHRLLRWVFRQPEAFLAVGQANAAYYRSFGVPSDKIIHCPHSIDIARFAGAGSDTHHAVARLRRTLALGRDAVTLLFAGKFEQKKQPVALMRAIIAHPDKRLVLVMAGDGHLKDEVEALARDYPARFRLLPFQNQSAMPALYRLADVFVLPSAYGETWGLAVNEAIACGCAAIVSDRVGCHLDVIDADNGKVFPYDNWTEFQRCLSVLISELQSGRITRDSCMRTATAFDVAVTARTTMQVCRDIRDAGRRAARSELVAG